MALHPKFEAHEQAWRRPANFLANLDGAEFALMAGSNRVPAEEKAGNDW